MKKVILSLVVLLCWTGLSKATPIIYTFSGQITEITPIRNGPPDEFNIFSVNDPVTYRILIDDEQPATLMNPYDGSIQVYPVISPIDYNYFYADYISGDLIVNETNTLSNEYTFHPSYANSKKHWGIIAKPNRGYVHGSFVVGTNNSDLQFFMNGIFGQSVENIHELLSLNISITMVNTVRDKDDRFMWVTSHVDITESIPYQNNPVPIPEPATLLLSGLGLLGFLRASRKKQHR